MALPHVPGQVLTVRVPVGASHSEQTATEACPGWRRVRFLRLLMQRENRRQRLVTVKGNIF